MSAAPNRLRARAERSAMIWPMHRAVWPIRPDLRPPVLFDLATDADVHHEILLCPNVVAELNACPADVWRGEGRPGCGWDGWEYEHVPLDEALAFQMEGEA